MESKWAKGAQSLTGRRPSSNTVTYWISKLLLDHKHFSTGRLTPLQHKRSRERRTLTLMIPAEVNIKWFLQNTSAWKWDGKWWVSYPGKTNIAGLDCWQNCLKVRGRGGSDHFFFFGCHRNSYYIWVSDWAKTMASCVSVIYKSIQVTDQQPSPKLPIWRCNENSNI